MTRPKIERGVLFVYIDTLMGRLAYLNQLRVGSIGLFFAIAALAATVGHGSEKAGTGPSFDVLLFSSVLLFIGVFVFLFDLRCRARASAVAQAIRAYLSDGNPDSAVRDRIGLWESFDEDAFFSVILMAVNALLAMEIVRLLLGERFSTAIQCALYIVFVCGQYLIYWKTWPRLAARMDELPDDPLLLPKRNDTDQGHGG